MSTAAQGMAIGGYHALETGQGRGLGVLAVGNRYESARAAMLAVLQVARPQAVWLPNFICGVVGDAVRAAGVPVLRYRLDQGFRVPADIQPGPGEWLLCVDYFGLGAAACDEAIARFGAARVLVDASQSLFHSPRPGATTVYSPRKFVGVPDGGLLVSPLALPTALPTDEDGSARRCLPLLTRLSQRVEDGYRQYLVAEASLDHPQTRAMSQLTAGLLAGIDFESIREARRRNYLFLANRLRHAGFRVSDLPVDAVPLCCPVTDVDGAALRPRLATRRVYVPHYWPDAIMPSDDHQGLALRDRTLYLPCDQRYDEPALTGLVQDLLASQGAP